MDLRSHRSTESHLVKTKIVATVGPAVETPDKLRQLIERGVDVFRLNFAHGTHEWLRNTISTIRTAAASLQRPIGLLGDLAGPKIRLGELPGDCLELGIDDRVRFVHTGSADEPHDLTCTYEELIDDLEVGDRVLLADGVVGLRVTNKAADGQSVECIVEKAGTIRSRQGVNLPGVKLGLPSLTDQDRVNLRFAIEQDLDFVGLSFVRSANDIDLLRSLICEHQPDPLLQPKIVAKIEKPEAIDDLDRILAATDAVMVARGDLGVEVDIVRVPILQKEVIRRCNKRRIPVITATQMLDSMQRSALPTRAEVSDVANAVLDGTDAVMLSGETAVGEYPLEAVEMMSRIAAEAEEAVHSIDRGNLTELMSHRWAEPVTEAVTCGAGAAAEHLQATIIVVATHSGRTAMAVSQQRRPIPIVALTDDIRTARRMCLMWGVTPVHCGAVHRPPEELLQFVVEWARRMSVISAGGKLVLIASTDWSAPGHDLMLVHTLPPESDDATAEVP